MFGNAAHGCSVLWVVAVMLGLSACHGMTDRAASYQVRVPVSNQSRLQAISRNVASPDKGALARAEVNPESAFHLIDGDADTTWVSRSGRPVVVELGALTEVTGLLVRKVGSDVNTSKTPDVLVELSADGEHYHSTSVSMKLGGGDIACSVASLGAAAMSCTLAQPYLAKYVRLSSQNGQSFHFKALEVLADVGP